MFMYTCQSTTANVFPLTCNPIFINGPPADKKNHGCCQCLDMDLKNEYNLISYRQCLKAFIFCMPTSHKTGLTCLYLHCTFPPCSHPYIMSLFIINRKVITIIIFFMIKFILKWTPNSRVACQVKSDCGGAAECMHVMKECSFRFFLAVFSFRLVNKY